MRTAIYLRVSTAHQSTDMQRAELLAACAARGWAVERTYADQGISGAKTRAQRPELDNMLKAATRREFDVLAVWSVDRLGRSLQDLLATLTELDAAGVRLYLHKQSLDTATPAGRALFGMLGVFAEFERTIICERVRSGIARRRAGGRPWKGRYTSVTEQQRETARAALAMGASLGKAARAAGISRATAQRIRREI
jgi:DNA invertase Pin-like site-specific DNA recombinase